VPLPSSPCGGRASARAGLALVTGGSGGAGARHYAEREIRAAVAADRGSLIERMPGRTVAWGSRLGWPLREHVRRLVSRGVAASERSSLVCYVKLALACERPGMTAVPGGQPVTWPEWSFD
jgi:hypothetical protein